MRDNLRSLYAPMRSGLRANFGPERANFRSERGDFGSEGDRLGPGRSDLRLEGQIGDFIRPISGQKGLNKGLKGIV